LFGFFLFSWLADNKGRRLALGLSWLLASLGALLMGLAWSWWSLTIGFFLSGFGVNPAITIHFSFMNEHSSNFFFKFTNKRCILKDTGDM